MSSLEKYQESRKRLDDIVRKSYQQIGDHFQILVTHRADRTQAILHEWYEFFSKNTLIRRFDDYIQVPKDLDMILAKSYTDYFRYIIAYRITHGNVDNIIFSKIISFELYFFNKNQILPKIDESSQSENNLNINEGLCYKNPIGHFLYYRIQKELHVNSNLSPIQQNHFSDHLMQILLLSLLQFFYKHTDINVFDFYNFIQEPSQIQLKRVLDTINSD